MEVTTTTDAVPTTLFVALELSRTTWLVALHSTIADKVSQHRLEGGDTEGSVGADDAQAWAGGGEGRAAIARRLLL